jgi:hypothetical protein
MGENKMGDRTQQHAAAVRIRTALQVGDLCEDFYDWLANHFCSGERQGASVGPDVVQEFIDMIERACDDTDEGEPKASPIPVVCDNCDWSGDADDVAVGLEDVPSLGDRIDPGSVVPFGECPECGNLCYLADKDGDIIQK